MDEPSDTTSGSLASVLASFDSLPDEEKTIAVRHILHKSGNTKSTSEDTSTGQEIPLIPVSHSCLSCHKLVIHEGRTETLDGRQVSATASGDMWFSKDTLLQALLRGCVLADWVLALLSQDLIEFKSDLDTSGVRSTRKRNTDGIGSAIDDADYVSTQTGIQITVSVGYDGERAFIALHYELDPLLVDKLWTATQDKQKYNHNYRVFVESYAPKSHASFRLSTTNDDAAALLIHKRPSTVSFDSEESFSLARNWLSECQQSHELCPKSEGLLPARVIDIGERFPIRSVRLYWSEEGERARYAALSYCWGGPQTLASTRSKAQDYTDGIILSQLPQTLRDAIITTSKLGIRYLWIDCLCIIQDDPEDVAREVSKMSQIFSEATVTISAASARSAQDGFLQPRKTSSDAVLKMAYQSAKGNMGTVLMEQPQRYAPEEDPISLRAWTLQEHVLSRRILMYSTRELWWTCSKGSLQDRNTSYNLEHGLNERKLFRNGVRYSLDYWRSIVQDYTRRFLTYPSDKLPAIAGVAADYSKIFGCAYLAGLWEVSFTSELMWSVKRSDISRPAFQRAPSWSWAAVDGEISHDWCPLDHAGTLDVLYCEVCPVRKASLFGSVDPTRSILKVEGELGRFFWANDKQYIFETMMHYWNLNPESPSTVDVARTQADADEEVPRDPETGYKVVWALVVTRNPTRGLLLAQVSEDTFRRVGIFYRFWNESYLPSERKVITII